MKRSEFPPETPDRPRPVVLIGKSSMRSTSTGVRFDMRAVARCVTCALLISVSPAVLPHYLWIERDGANARIYFGEVNEVREQSPGRLDEMVAPRLVSMAADGSARDWTAERRRGSFAAPGAGAAPNLVATEARYAVQDWTRNGLGIVKPMFYARFSPWPIRGEAPASSAMRLDVRPVAGGKSAVEVLFEGKPLAGAKVVVHAPNGWDQDQKTDDGGRAAVSMPWRGQYVFEVIHKEAARGEFEGKAYEAVRHRATLTVAKRAGVDPKGTGSLAPRASD